MVLVLLKALLVFGTFAVACRLIGYVLELREQLEEREEAAEDYLTLLDRHTGVQDELKRSKDKVASLSKGFVDLLDQHTDATAEIKRLEEMCRNYAKQIEHLTKTYVGKSERKRTKRARK